MNALLSASCAAALDKIWTRMSFATSPRDAQLASAGSAASRHSLFRLCTHKVRDMMLTGLLRSSHGCADDVSP